MVAARTRLAAERGTFVEFLAEHLGAHLPIRHDRASHASDPVVDRVRLCPHIAREAVRTRQNQA